MKHYQYVQKTLYESLKKIVKSSKQDIIRLMDFFSNPRDTSVRQINRPAKID